MSGTSQLVSLRITEEDLFLLDQRVGFDGARNRSDVIRLAIQNLLANQPALPDMKTVSIPLGRGDQLNLGRLYELRGITPEHAAQEGLKLYIRQSIDDITATNNELDALLETSRSATIPRKEFHQ